MALAEDGQLLHELSDPGPQSHSERLAPMIQQLLDQAELTWKNLDAVAISAGPGSYTGLRIGHATAKGICFGRQLPLIHLSTLRCMAFGVGQQMGFPTDVQYWPMIDARRDEVFCALYDADFSEKKKPFAYVLSKSEMNAVLDQSKTVICGTGAEKSKPFLIHKNTVFNSLPMVTAGNMCRFAEARWRSKTFEDSAYAEPFYLKAFAGSKPKSTGKTN